MPCDCNFCTQKGRVRLAVIVFTLCVIGVSIALVLGWLISRR